MFVFIFFLNTVHIFFSFVLFKKKKKNIVERIKTKTNKQKNVRISNAEEENNRGTYVLAKNIGHAFLY